MRNVTPVTRSEINTLRLQLWQFAQSSLKKLCKLPKINLFYLFGTYKGKWLQFWRWQRIINLLLPKSDLRHNTNKDGSPIWRNFPRNLKRALSLVQKPGRYTGGEPGCIYKDKSKVDVRMAFCFPDTYEIGMSFLGEKILYDILNRHENWWCERAFMPWTDMKEQMERLDIPLYCLESKDPLCDFDIVRLLAGI